MRLPITAALEPGTEAYYEANQNHLCIILLALAKGYHSARSAAATKYIDDWRLRVIRKLLEDIIEDYP